MAASPFAYALEFLLRTVLDLAIFNFMARFIFQLVRADFFNPLSQFILKITNPVLTPLKRFLPTVQRIDTACLLIIILLTTLKLTSTFWLQFYKAPHVAGLLVWTFGDVINEFIYFFFFAIIIQAVLSWVNQGQYNPLNLLLSQITAPLLRPVRRWIKPIGGFDISMIPVLIILQLLIILIANPLMQLGVLLASH